MTKNKKIYKSAKLILFSLSLLLLTSCIEIIEDITINKDQSGTVSYRLETDDWVSMFMDNFSLEQENPIQGNDGKISAFIEKLRQQEGITKVDYDLKPGNEYLTIDFKNTEYLNKALYSTFDQKMNFLSPSYIKANGHKLKKKNISPYIKQYLKREDIAIPEKQILSNIIINTHYHLPGDIKNLKGNNIIKTSNNSAAHKVSLSDFIENHNVSSVRIKY